MTAFMLALVSNLFIAFGIFSIIFVLKKIEKYILKYIYFVIALTVGLLLGIVFIGFLPEVLKNSVEKISIVILLGILVFLLLEFFLHRHHCRELGDECEKKSHHYHHTNALLMSISTFIHNFIHGIVIFSGFAVSSYFGWITAFSVFLHAIPQNIANFLLSMRNMKLVYIAVGANILGILFLYPFKDFILINKYYVLAFVAGGLLYIALTDMLPEFKKGVDSDSQNYYKFIYFLIVVLGIIIVYLVNLLH